MNGSFQLSELLGITDIDRGIYRFFNVDTGTHFLSGNTLERDSVINNIDAFNYEGLTFRAADASDPTAEIVFRFFNTQTSTHFFTQSNAERDSIFDNLLHFNFEGEAYQGYTEQVDGSIPLYRFFNT
jgi:lysyl endopeptidase